MNIKPRHLAWRFALTSFAFAGLAGFVLGAQQFFLKFLYDQSAHLRTAWGLLFMLLAILGPALPLILISKREAFARLRGSGQWTAALAIPLLYASVLGLCLLASHYTKTLMMRRPGLRMLVCVDPVHPDQFTTVEMHGLGHALSSSGSWRARPDFHFVGYETYRRFPREVTMNASGTARKRDDGNVEISLNFEATEAFRLQLDGLAGVKLTEGGQVVSNDFKFQPGRHQVIAAGRPK